MAAARQLELDRARAEGRKDAEDEAFRTETKDHFKVINGSIAKTVERLGKIEGRLGNIEGAMATDEKVDQALAKVAETAGAKKFTRLQAIAIVAVGLATVGAFVLSIVVALNA